MSTVVGQDGFPVPEGGVVPQNRKPTGRRSDRTKAAILAAARKHFAASGYERATIRAIAADAGIDPAMVMRYFGDKEKLLPQQPSSIYGCPTWRPCRAGPSAPWWWDISSTGGKATTPCR